MKNIKKSINELKGKFLGGQYEKFIIENKKDFLLIVKDIMQENGKVSEEADELLNHHIASMRKFCEKHYVEKKDEFIAGIIETNFIAGIDDITADITEDDDVEFHKFKDRVEQYEVAKNIIRERAGLKPLERVTNVLLSMGIPLVPKDDEISDVVNIPSFYELFYFRTYICDKLLENMEKIHSIGTPKTPLEEIELAKCKEEIDRIIENKNKNIVEYSKEMDDYILENNLIFDKLNKMNYHLTIIMDKKEFNKNPFKVFLSFTTPNVQIEESEDGKYVIINLNCRNKAEIYTLFRALKKYKLEFEELIVCAYVKEDAENRSFYSSRVSFDVDKVYELAEDYNFDIIKYMNKKDCDFIGLRAIYRLTVPSSLFSFMSYGIYLSGLDMINLASTLYEIVEKNYKAYCVLFSYILLYKNEKNIRSFLKKISSNPDDSVRERVVKIVEAAEELGIFDVQDIELGYLSNMVNMKVRELILNNKYGELNDVIALVDNAYIGTMTTAHSEKTSSYDKSSN